MAIVKALSSKSGVGKIINYICREEKTEKALVYRHNIIGDPIEQMEATKILYNKTGGRTHIHIIQSFNDPAPASLIHEAGRKLIEKSPLMNGHEVLMATHTDCSHLHNHIVINSVNFENGRKIQMSKKDLQELKDLNDEICLEKGLSVITPDERLHFKTDWKRKNTPRTNSWKEHIGEQVMFNLYKSKNRREFIESLRKTGIGTDWAETRKHVVFTDLARETAGEKKYKIRAKKLENLIGFDLSKEGIEHFWSCNTEMKGYYLSLSDTKNEHLLKEINYELIKQREVEFSRSTWKIESDDEWEL